MQLLEIEKELAGSDGKSAMARYDDVLVSLSHRLSEALDAGMSPEAFARCSELAEVVTIARKLLRLQLRKTASPSPDSISFDRVVEHVEKNTKEE